MITLTLTGQRNINLTAKALKSETSIEAVPVYVDEHLFDNVVDGQIQITTVDSLNNPVPTEKDGDKLVIPGLPFDCPPQPLFRAIGLTNHTTLNENSPLGNRNRFPFEPNDTDGNPISGVFLNWNKAGFDVNLNKRWVLMVDATLYGNSNWQSAIDSANESIVGKEEYLGTWKVWSVDEAENMFEYLNSAGCCNWWPTGPLSATTWTRTEIIGSSANVHRFNNTASGLSTSIGKTLNQTHIRTRICYIDDELETTD